MAVYQDGQRIGFTHRAVTSDAAGATLFEESLLNLKVLEAQRRVRTLVHAKLDSAYALERADFTLLSEATRFQATAEAKGNVLTVQLDFDGTLSTYSLPLEARIFLPQSVRTSLRPGEMKEGMVLRVVVWDPLMSTNHELVVRVVSREPVPDRLPLQDSWRLEEELHGVRTTAWLGLEGDVLREEGPLGIVLVRTTRESALAEIDPSATMDIAKRASVAVGPIDAARERTTLRVRLSGIGLEKVPTDDEQGVAGDVLSIVRAPLAARDTYVLPYRGDHDHDMRATVFLQSDHPRLRALAKKIVDGERDAQVAVRRLNDWVYDYVEKTPTISVPNALQVLDSARGDCNEHAVLLAALARAAGLPARVAAGLVYLDEAFLYHAWCEVWLGRWVSMDPALHQFPADATHIKLVEGDPDQHAVLLGLVGKLRIEVLE